MADEATVGGKVLAALDAGRQIAIERSQLPITEAAAVLGRSRRTLERWISEGAPVVRRGARGRGRCTLLDVTQVRAWRNGHVVFYSRLPEVVADAAFEAWCLVEGPHKRDCAGALAAAWYLITSKLNDELDRPPVTEIPERIAHLRRIFVGSAKVHAMSHDMEIP